MDEVTDLLKTWELPDLIPIFEEQAITIQALSALTPDDIKDVIPQIGRRVLFMRCWKEWKEEFSSISLSNLDLLPFDLHQGSPIDGPKEIIILSAESHKEKEQVINIEQDLLTESCHQRSECGLLESVLRKSLEASSLLLYKGGTLDGDAARNLLVSIITNNFLICCT